MKKSKKQYNQTKRIREIYGEVNNLKPFIDPVHGQKFDFASNKELIRICQKICRKIIESGYENIVYSECGISPMVYICKKILDSKGNKVNWIPVKFPREPYQNISELLLFYLSDKEKNSFLSASICSQLMGFQQVKTLCSRNLNSRTLLVPSEHELNYSLEKIPREKIIKSLVYMIPEDLHLFEKPDLEEILRSDYQRKSYHEIFNLVFKDTKIAESISSFLYFDEYLDSGTTLRNAIYYLNYFSKIKDWKVLSYCIKLPKADRLKRVFYTLYDRDSEFICYKNGAYPFENRIDLIGYLYITAEKEYKKIELGSLKKEISHKVEYHNILEEPEKEVADQGWLNRVKNFCPNDQVSDYLDMNHVLRFLFFVCEKKLNINHCFHEYLWQLFDMYGPVWTPMPKENHFTFWHAFERFEETIGEDDLRSVLFKYKMIRSLIIKTSLELCLKRRNKWIKDVDAQLKGD